MFWLTINNAGIGGESKKIHELTEKDWDEVIDVNLKGAFLCAREAIKKMMKNGSNRQGRINKIIQLSTFRLYMNRHLISIRSICSFEGRHGKVN